MGGEKIISNCQEKKQFFLKKDAKRVARIRSLRAKIHLEIYRCPNCGNWHLTSNTNDRWAKRRIIIQERGEHGQSNCAVQSTTAATGFI